jgi:hypothetical protein
VLGALVGGRSMDIKYVLTRRFAHPEIEIFKEDVPPAVAFFDFVATNGGCCFGSHTQREDVACPSTEN